jgi:hypothetical protein
MPFFFLVKTFPKNQIIYETHLKACILGKIGSGIHIPAPSSSLDGTHGTQKCS